jgi:hypothetical protein
MWSVRARGEYPALHVAVPVADSGTFVQPVISPLLSAKDTEPAGMSVFAEMSVSMVRTVAA